MRQCRIKTLGRGVMVSFFDVFVFWVFFLGFTISLTQVFKKITGGLSLFFVFAIFSIGLWGLQIALLSTRIVEGYELICAFLIPVTFFAAASNPLRYQWLIQTGYHIEKWYYLFYIPSALTFVFLIPLMINPAWQVKGYLRFYPVITGEFFRMPVYYMVIQMLYPLAALYQVILASVILIRNLNLLKEQSDEPQRRVSREAFKALILITGSIFCVLIGQIFSLLFLKLSLIYCALALFSTFQNGIKYPIYDKLLRFEIDRVRQSASKIRSLDIDSIINRLRYIMEEEKAFAVESLTLRDTADELGLSVHQLSEIINKKLGKNFNSYINEYRIDEAKKMLLNEPERSIISIGTAVGFNAVSSFTTVFTRIAGCSPREYRRINILKQKK